MWPAAAQAQPPAAPPGPARPSAQPPGLAQGARARAGALARAGEHEAALAAIEAGLAQDPRDLELLQLRGTVLLEMRQYPRALAAFEALLAAGPTSGNRRKVMRIIRDLREVRFTFELELGVTPADAVVIVDGQVRKHGTRLDLAVGKHVLRVKCAGFFDHETRVSGEFADTMALDVALDERVPVTVSPPDARLFLDGRPVAIAEREVLELEDSERRAARGALRVPGERKAHTLVVEAEGHVPATVKLPAGQPPGQPLDIELARVPVVREWTAAKIVLVTGAGVAALAGYGAATVYAVREQRHMDRVRQACMIEQDGGLTCTEAGRVAAGAAGDAATSANQAFTAGTVLAMGMLHAGNMNERPGEDGGMSLRRKLSIGASAGVAVTGLAMGAWYGWRGRQLLRQADVLCRDPELCEREGFVRRQQARGPTSAASLGLAAAGVAMTSAALLWWGAPGPGDASDTRLRIEPVIRLDGLSLGISGRFP